MIQFVLLIIAKNPFMVFIAMFAQGLAFGNYLPSIRLFCYENAPVNLRTSAQTLADAICSSLSGVIGSAAGGIIIENYGVKAVLLIGIGLLVLSFGILLINILSRRRFS
jgi:PPP family 3-phenylpropionic acid transporter